MELTDLVKSYKFPISNTLTQMVNFPNWIPDCDTHSPALLDSFLSLDTSICSTMAFTPLGDSNVVSCCEIFHWFSFELKRGFPVSSHS